MHLSLFLNTKSSWGFCSIIQQLSPWLVNESVRTLDNRMKSKESRAFRAINKYLEKSLADSKFLFHFLSLSHSSVWHSEKTVTRDDPPKTPSSLFVCPVYLSMCVRMCTFVRVSQLLGRKRVYVFDATKANDKKKGNWNEKQTVSSRGKNRVTVDENPFFQIVVLATQKEKKKGSTRT